jgi:hypothetical protein
MNARRPALASTDVQTIRAQLDRMSLKAHRSEGRRPCPVGQQDHSGVAVTVSPMLARGVDQLVDVAGGQLTPGPG